MNCPSRTDEEDDPHHNQNPPALSADLTTRYDLNGRVNDRQLYLDLLPPPLLDKTNTNAIQLAATNPSPLDPSQKAKSEDLNEVPGTLATPLPSSSPLTRSQPQSNPSSSFSGRVASYKETFLTTIIRYAHFVGPGFLVAVAYIDPGNYATDISAGQSVQYGLLFIVLLSNVFAIVLQSLSIKLGAVTGLDLAECCRRWVPKYVCWGLYALAEGAIVATDVAEVIGTAIALNLLLHIPLIAGCCISLLDVVFIFLFYAPNGSMTKLRLFEYFVMCLVLGVIVCFGIQLAYIKDVSVGEVFKGYLPSSAVVKGNGLYLSCGILGATVMPHSIFLGSGMVQPRLREFDRSIQYIRPFGTDTKSPLTPTTPVVLSTSLAQRPDADDELHTPSLTSIKSTIRYATTELALSLFTFALFVNSAILIVAGASLYKNSDASDSASLFSIHALLTKSISPVAGTVFALALLLSGISAGIVCTIAGQMVSEGMIQWACKPWIRRLATRAVSVVPSVAIAAAVGRDGLDTALLASQVILCVILPFVTAPLVWFTSSKRIMSVRVPSVVDSSGNTEGVLRPADRSDTHSPADVENVESATTVSMANSWSLTVLAGIIWCIIAIMNVALLVFLGMGKD